MLYLLLSIIAIGVLLASPEGKALLSFLLKLGLFAGVVYLVFWAVAIVFGLLSDKGIRDNIFAVIGYSIFAVYAILGIYVAYKKTNTKNKRAEIIVKLKNEIKYQWVEHKTKFILVIVLILIIIFSWIILPIFYF